MRKCDGQMTLSIGFAAGQHGYDMARCESWLRSVKDATDELIALYHSLCELYPDSAETFTVNYERMVKLMDEASLQLTGLNDGIKHEAVAALFEGAPYILDEIGIEWQYIYPRELASDINGEDLTEILELLNESGVQAVLIEQQAPTTLKRALSDAGYTVRQVSTLTTLNKPTLEEYIDVIASNAHAAIG